ncbi:P-loop NTPase family protein [Enterococcus sp. LJL99]
MIVIGCPGAGKSTFSRKLREYTNLPLYYLDLLWHKKDQTTISKETFDERLKQLLIEEKWIIDGNYLRTLDIRLAACDTVFLLDYPLEVCLAGVESRIGKAREDMPWIESEFDPEFRQWIIDFHQNQLPTIYRLLEENQNNKNIFVFNSRSEANHYFSKLANHVYSI